MENINRTETFSCTDCDDFSMEKSFSGLAGTPGHDEYEQIAAPDQCPACGGDVEPEGDSEQSN